MKFLQVSTRATVLKLTSVDGPTTIMEEQAAPFLTQNPLLVLDVGGLAFSSWEIGELVNLAKRFSAHWDTRVHRIGVVNVSEAALAVFQATRLETIFEKYHSLSDALERFAALRMHPRKVAARKGKSA